MDLIYFLFFTWLWLDYYSDNGDFKNYKLVLAIISTFRVFNEIISLIKLGSYIIPYLVCHTINVILPGYLRTCYKYNDFSKIKIFFSKISYCDDGLINIYESGNYIIKKYDKTINAYFVKSLIKINDDWFIYNNDEDLDFLLLVKNQIFENDSSFEFVSGNENKKTFFYNRYNKNTYTGKMRFSNNYFLNKILNKDEFIKEKENCLNVNNLFIKITNFTINTNIKDFKYEVIDPLKNWDDILIEDDYLYLNFK